MQIVCVSVFFCVPRMFCDGATVNRANLKFDIECEDFENEYIQKKSGATSATGNSRLLWA